MLCFYSFEQIRRINQERKRQFLFHAYKWCLLFPTAANILEVFLQYFLLPQVK